MSIPFCCLITAEMGMRTKVGQKLLNEIQRQQACREKAVCASILPFEKNSNLPEKWLNPEYKVHVEHLFLAVLLLVERAQASGRLGESIREEGVELGRANDIPTQYFRSLPLS
jgi:hypothetical protein